MIGYRRGKTFFEITAFLNLEPGTSRAGNSNENKGTKTDKSQLLLSVRLFRIFCS